MTLKSVGTQQVPQQQSSHECRTAPFVILSRYTRKRLSVTTAQIPWIGVLLEKPASSHLVKFSAVYTSRTVLKKPRRATLIQ
jgi:hypothetical protein